VDLGVVGDQPNVTPDPDRPTVLNSFPYEYAVVTWDWSDVHEQILSPKEWFLVYPSVDPTTSVGRVRVVPNPYVLEAGWETGESKVVFTNVPADAKISIFDAAGGFVNTIRPNKYSYDDSQKQGSADWNLKNGRGEDIVSGIYVFFVESRYGEASGRFIVVR
jgi:hypothetical protein